MVRFLSREQNDVDVTNELSFLEVEAVRPKEGSRWLRISPSAGWCHAPAITSCLHLLLQTQLCT